MNNNRLFIIELQMQIDELKEQLKEKDFKIADLNRKLAKQECELNRYKNYVRVNTGGEL